MKLFAYISIFLIVHSNVIFAGERAARALREGLSRRSRQSRQSTASPQPPGRGNQYNPKVNEVPVPKIPIGQVVNNQWGGNSVVSDNSSSFSESNSSGQSQSGSQGLGKQLQNLSSALPLPANSPASTQAKDGDLERKLPGTPNGGNSSGGSSEGQSFGKWWPVCVLIDPSIGDANKQITELVQMSAACQVNLVPFVRVVSGFNPEDEASINNAQRSTCNLKEAGVAEKGSTLVITNQSSTVADKMCRMDGKDENGKEKTEVAGCNQLGSGASGESKKIAEGKKRSGDGFGGIAEGSVAVGIVDAQGYTNGKIWSHEAIGHGEMAWPNGEDAGNGIGDPNNKDEASSGEGKEGAYTGKGCAQMQASAIPDPQHYRKFYSDKTRYYSHESQSKKPMQLGEPIWKTFKDGPQTPDVAQKNSTAPPRGNDQNSSPPGSPSPLATAGPGHKKPLGQVSRGTEIRSGDANKESGRVAKRGGDDSPDAAGSAVDGKGTGEAFGNKTIGVNQDAQNSDGSNPNSGSGTQSSDFFAGSKKSESGSSDLGGVSSKDSGSRETQTALSMKRKKTGYGGLNDPDYLANSTPPETKEPKRKRARVGDAQVAGGDAQVAGAGVKPNRTPASSTTNLNSSPSRALRNQVNFGGGV
jgi:hypothetical protein